MAQLSRDFIAENIHTCIVRVIAGIIYKISCLS